jgi:ApeA N-terminal domain 1
MTEPTETILEKRGYFWWDGEKTPKGRYAPPHGVPGVLTIREDGKVRLNVTASLLQSKALGMTPPDRNRLDGDRERFKGKCIAGVIDGQRRSVYLKKLICRSFGREIDGKGSEEFESELCIVGNTATTRAEASLRFSKLSISLAGLEDWRRGDLLAAGNEKADGVNRSRDVIYTDTPIEYELKDGTIALRTDVHCTAVEGLPYREISLRQYDWLEYDRKRATTPEAMQERFTRIEELLAILTGTYYSLDWPLISMKGKGKGEMYTLYFWRNIERARRPEMSNLWTIFPQVRGHFGLLYENWKKKRQQYGPGFYLYLGALIGQPMYIEHRFANLMWGIESLHREMEPSPPQSRRQQKRIQSILTKAGSFLNSDERGWLKGQLRNGTEPPLEYRIISTFSGLPWKITKSTLEEFAKRCRERRNEISHHGGPRDRKASYEVFLRELMELTEGLAPLYHAALLQEIGLEAKTLEDCGKMQIGFRIRRGLELAKLQAEGLKAPEPVDMEAHRKFHKQAVRKWRRRQARKKRQRAAGT